ncbi:MAG: sulfotransferase [Bacteriovoracaceae bacterium]
MINFFNKGQLPNFIIIGSMKCGTSSLYKYLSQHPAIFMNSIESVCNEFHFFDSDLYQKGEKYYKSFFPKKNCIQGEKTARYIFDLACHAKMAKMVPKAKLILILRDPVMRSYSHWNHFNQKKDRKNWIKTDFENSLKLHPELLERGKYIDQIEHLLQFFKREQLYIIHLEKLQKDVRHEVDAIFRFLGVGPLDSLDTTPDNVRVYTDSLQSSTYDYLKNYFKPYNERLFNFLDYRIPEWD